MGHERLPLLPRSEKWRDIVRDLGLIDSGESTAENITEDIVKAIDYRFRHLYLDPGVQKAFSFLLALTQAARSTDPVRYLAEHGIEIEDCGATPLALSRESSAFLKSSNGSLEYAELARTALSRALAVYYNAESRQSDLLTPGGDPFHVWRRASEGAGFSVLAREFFSQFTTEYIRYFVDREASAVIDTVQSREQLSARLEAHIDRIARHAFETSKITQSFAAGWYNKNALEAFPSARKTRGFLGVAFNKLRDALGRKEVA